jgi:hypothetical protein
MEEIFTRVWNDLVDRIGGPLSLRLFLQPIMATIFAIRDGLKDAREGRPAYFWALFTNPDERRDLLRSGWKSVVNVFCLAVVLDVVYQFIALRKFYPGEALIVAFILAILPYLLIRGPVNRIARLLKSKATASEKVR